MNISASDISAFLACRRQWDWSSPNRQNLMRLGLPSIPLWLGTGVHEALELWYRPVEVGNPPSLDRLFIKWATSEESQMSTAEWGVYRDAFMMGAWMLGNYQDEYGHDPREDIDGFTVLVTEQEFSVPIMDYPRPRYSRDELMPVGNLVGRMDGLIRDRNGLYWVVDHKTFTNKPDRDLMPLNLQILAYTYAAQQLSNAGALRHLGIPQGAHIEGALYNGLRKPPKWRNDRLPESTVPWFMREWVSHNLRELVVFENDLKLIHSEMAPGANEMLPGTVTIYPTTGRGCGFCEFQTPCVAKLFGEDWQWELKAHYGPRPSRGEVYGPPDAVVEPDAG